MSAVQSLVTSDTQSYIDPERCKDLTFSPVSVLHVPYSSELSPRDFIQFAGDDLKESTARSRINAFGNAKRALHLQLETLAKALGIRHFDRRRNELRIVERRTGTRTAFPELTRFCAECGVVNPDILRQLNHQRNMVEHEYHVPTEDEAATCVDVVKLFLCATNRLLAEFPKFVLFHSDASTCGGLSRTRVGVDFPPEAGHVTVTAESLDTSDQEWHAEAARWVGQLRLRTFIVPSKIKQLRRRQWPYALAFEKMKTVRSFRVEIDSFDRYSSWVSLIVSKVIYT